MLNGGIQNGFSGLETINKLPRPFQFVLELKLISANINLFNKKGMRELECKNTLDSHFTSCGACYGYLKSTFLA